MAFGMTGTDTYARSATGAKTLKNTAFASDIARIRKTLDESHLNNLKKVVHEYWQGADAEDFLNDINKTRTTILSKINTLDKQFDAAIDAEAKEFASFQTKNIK